MECAGHITGRAYSSKETRLRTPRSLAESIAEAYEESSGDPIYRLLEALAAGQAAGLASSSAMTMAALTAVKRIRNSLRKSTVCVSVFRGLARRV